MTGACVLITLGVLFLMNNLYPTQFEFGRMWPVILIVIGVVKIVDYFQRPAPVQGATTARRPLPPAPKPASVGPSPGPVQPVQTTTPRQSAHYSGVGSEASRSGDKADSEPRDDEGSSSSGSGKED